MDESQKLCRLLEEVEAEFPEAEIRKAEALKAAEPLILSQLTAERLCDPDARVVSLQKQVDERKKIINAEMDELRAKQREIRQELAAITDPEIARANDRLGRELLTLKLERKVIGQTSSGFDMKERVEIVTNEPALAEVHRLVADGKKELAGMRYRTLREIEDFVTDQLRKIRAVDLTPKRKIADAFLDTASHWAISPLT